MDSPLMQYYFNYSIEGETERRENTENGST